MVKPSNRFRKPPETRRNELTPEIWSFTSRASCETLWVKLVWQWNAKKLKVVSLKLSKNLSPPDHHVRRWSSQTNFEMIPFKLGPVKADVVRTKQNK